MPVPAAGLPERHCAAAAMAQLAGPAAAAGLPCRSAGGTGSSGSCLVWRWARCCSC